MVYNFLKGYTQLGLNTVRQLLGLCYTKLAFHYYKKFLSNFTAGAQGQHAIIKKWNRKRIDRLCFFLLIITIILLKFLYTSAMMSSHRTNGECNADNNWDIFILLLPVLSYSLWSDCRIHSFSTWKNPDIIFASYLGMHLS